ncbi:MAG: hypothetical protein GX025_08135 [Clostridiales bacterium]|nr:hypothetical protein [Clostridiales bacterium]
MNTIAFALTGGDSLYTLSSGTALSGFVSFDLGPFYEKCLAFTESALNTHEYDETDALLIKDLLRGCHPFVTASYNSIFDKIVLDCVIDIICQMKNTGLEALWAENISASDSLGTMIFSRISEYKSCHAINQWVNLQRMQNYAKSKAAYVFPMRNTSLSDCRLRAIYFDLAFARAAKKSGAGPSIFQTAGISSPALLPASAMLMSHVTATLDPIVSALTEETSETLPQFKGGCYDEQISGMLCESLSKLPLPDSLEMVSMAEKLRRFPPRAYCVSTLKQMVDLEIEELLVNEMMLWPSEETGRLEVLSIEPIVEDVPLEEEIPLEAPAPAAEKKRKKAETAPEEKSPPKKAPAATKKAKPPKEKEQEDKKSQAKAPKKAKEKDETSAKASKPDVGENMKAPPAEEEGPPISEVKSADDKGLAEAGEEKQPSPPSENTSEVPLPSDIVSPNVPSAEPAAKTVPDSIEERMRLLQDLAAEKNSPIPNAYKNQDIDILCQSVHTALKAALRTERNLQEVEVWAKHLFRIRGGMMAKRFSKDYLLRFLSATVMLYKLDSFLTEN